MLVPQQFISQKSMETIIDDICTSYEVYNILKLNKYIKSPSRYEIVFDLNGYDDRVEDNCYSFNADVTCVIYDRKSNTSSEKYFTIRATIDSGLEGSGVIGYDKFSFDGEYVLYDITDGDWMKLTMAVPFELDEEI